MIYHAYQTQEDVLGPMRIAAMKAAPTLHDFGAWGWDPVRRFAAACEVFTLARLTHRRPEFGIDSIVTGKRELAVTEQNVHTTPFATLLRFRKDTTPAQPRVLIVAPMSGHFATLLRESARTMLRDHDVYITDWHNARDVPMEAGRFGIDEYIDHIIEFLNIIGPGTHLVAICQPCVEALAAVALMAEDGHAATPASLTLMAGPIDCRVNPTAVNELATSRPMRWFEHNLIEHVPVHYAGMRRRVYPGFLQLSAFLNMNLQRHIKSFKDYFEQLVQGDHEKAAATRRFYEEYFAVSDLSADFYLETVKLVFQEHALARGKLKWRDRPINPRAIRRTALLTVEGERDDICALGQTLAAQDLCEKLPQYLRTHYVQAGVGHYGVFSGKRWESQVYPAVRDVIYSSE
ncbi:MAG: polyhydroxyalkanoate depolymerase [Betaproteobacteria bacterium]|nr:MAG: polyhydroxyalkanoate depolymerase [Betaproteobacteria bacterium]